MRVVASIPVVLALTTGAAIAQQAPAGEPASYCVSASGAFIASEVAGLAEARAKCRKGDTLVIPAASSSVVARICDFSRAVVSAGGNVVCVWSGSERGRR